ncbi:MAG: UDP-N-acetylmuramoyl-L-alanine--D-glutamate ligase [Caldilineaceae bacterium]|nr:UDP-N-acetylmuramoyl-L-alanine--D-glutamate ligase [Caldilineaceae bacterium]
MTAAEKRTQEENRFADKKVVILGLGRQGLALARFFVEQGARVIISDRAGADARAAELTALGDLPVETALGGHPPGLLDNCDLLCLSGGVPTQIDFVQAAIARDIPLSNDVLLTMQLAREKGLGPIVGITGSSGKTTTTTLVGEMLTAAGLNAHVGGNIGVPLIDRLHAIQPGEPMVLELSSFQLELFDPALAWGELTGIGPDVTAVLNVTPNHLDRHPDMRAYAEAKFNLLRVMPPGKTAVFNAANSVTGRLLGSANPPALPAEWRLDEPLRAMRQALTANQTDCLGYSRLQPLRRGGWLDANRLLLDGKLICRRSEVRLRGDHNLGNLLAAAVISQAAGAGLAAISRVAQTFAGVPHRLEVVAREGGVTWINDSIATSPERAAAALRSFSGDETKLILLAGGKDKNLPWREFADLVVDRVSMLIGFGDAGPMIVRLVQDRAEATKRKAPTCALVQRLDEAVSLAQRTATPQSIVLLSPGGTSYDAYRDFEERGEHFRALVNQTAPAPVRQA